MPQRPAPPTGFLGVSRRPSRREWRGALVLFAVGSVGLVLALLFIHPRATLLAVGTAAPDVSLDAAGGGHVDVARSTAGRPYVLEFFEAGCAHCQQVAGELCHEPVPVFAADAAKESASTISSYRQQFAHGCTYPMLVDPALAAGAAYAVNAVPTVYLIRGGRLAYAGAGLEGVAGLTAAVQKVTGG